MWPPSSSRNTGGGPSTPPPPLGYGIPPELGMFVVAPAAFHHPAVTQHHHVDPMILPGDPHNNNHASNATTALGVGVNVIPLLTASPCLNNPTGGAIDESDIVDAANRGGRTGGGGGAIHLWQTQQQQHNFTPPHEVNYLKKAGESISFDQNVNLFNSSGGGSGLGGGLSGAGTLTCQDCGNQAKKDCSHRRCRTCCRSRGFDCSTHVKSTWVPAARRRERQVMTATRPSGGGGGGDGASSGSTSGAKKPRLITSQNTTTTSHTSASNTPPRSYETSSSHQDASLKERLPGQVRAPAVFKCVRVSAVDDGSEDEYAYQAVVKIGGHVFKGFLYDQGMESREGFPNLSDLHVSGGGGCSSSRHGGGGVGPSPNNPLLDPSEVYGASASNAAGGDGAGILGGSTFGNTIG